MITRRKFVESILGIVATLPFVGSLFSSSCYKKSKIEILKEPLTEKERKERTIKLAEEMSDAVRRSLEWQAYCRWKR